jgi:hypothetical protein
MKKNLEKNLIICVDFLKVTDEKSRILNWIRILWSEIRIRTKMSRIRNTKNVHGRQQYSFL